MASRRRDWQVLVTTRARGVRQLYLIPGKGYSYRRGDTGRVYMTAGQAEAAKKWARRRLARDIHVLSRRHRHPFLQLASGARWPTNRRLLRGLNRTARKRHRFIRIISGLRTPHEAWILRQKYVRYRLGVGPYANLAAPCCSRYGTAEVLHSWDHCGRDPWSNHADGNAADCGTIHPRSGVYTSLDSDRQAGRLARAHGLHFPVPNEPWHAEPR